MAKTHFSWAERDYPPDTIDLMAGCDGEEVAIMVPREAGIALYDLVIKHILSCEKESPCQSKDYALGRDRQPIKRSGDMSEMYYEAHVTVKWEPAKLEELKPVLAAFLAWRTSWIGGDFEPGTFISSRDQSLRSLDVDMGRLLKALAARNVPVLRHKVELAVKDIKVSLADNSEECEAGGSPP